MRDYPAMVDHTTSVEPVPRRIRGVLGGAVVFDTTEAVYVWDSPKYPAYYIPVADLDHGLLVGEGRSRRLRRGSARTFDLRVGDVTQPDAVRIYGSDADPGVADTARFEWAALDAWYEEDEQSSSIRVTPTPGSTRSGRAVRCGSSWTGSCWPSPHRR